MRASPSIADMAFELRLAAAERQSAAMDAGALAAQLGAENCTRVAADLAQSAQVLAAAAELLSGLAGRDDLVRALKRCGILPGGSA